MCFYFIPLHLYFIVLLLTDIEVSMVESVQREHFRVKEELQQGAIVGQITASTWFGKLPPVNVVFISLAQNPLKSYFKVNRATGAVTVGRRLDRETVCAGNADKALCMVDFKVSLTAAGGRNAIIGVRIQIDDINDNKPLFSKPSYHLSISESSHKGSETALPRARDSDGPDHDILRYEMRPEGNSAEYFEVIQRKLREKRLQPYLRQKKALDRESIRNFNFHLRAIDGGGNLGEVPVAISVLDSNDNYPTFFGLPYRRNISECTAASQEILAVQAVDKDEGKNSQIKYQLSNLASQTIRDKFYMYANKLFLSNQLDFETMPKKLSIPVEAIDGGDLSTLTEVEIWIQDCNDNDPVIRILLASGDPGSFVNLVENRPESRQIATVMVTDRDTGERGRTTCHLSDVDRFDLQPTRESDNSAPLEGESQDRVFTLYKRQGVTFDRERTQRLVLRIVCTDHGDQPRQAQKELVIEILDENDNAPVFLQQLRFNLAENNDQGARIGMVRAKDRDSGVNSHIKYDILEEHMKQKFEITSRGELFAIVKFDREEQDVYKFTVRATDKGKPALSANTSITVVITDVNDCYPEYIGERDFYIEESDGRTMVLYTLGRLNATDLDKGLNGSVVFSLEHNAVSPAKVSRFYRLTNGILSVNGVLDREAYPIHRLNITIKDRGFPQRSSSVQLTVTLLDLNDNSPEFVYPSLHDNTFNLSRDTPVGSTLKVIKAIDADLGENASITYFLRQDHMSQHFTLERTGILLLNKAFDTSSYINSLLPLQVTARDGGNVSRSTKARVTVVVLSNKVTEVRRRDGSRPPGEINGESGEGNMLVLLSLAATVVFIFVIVLVVFGYIYLRGETLCCFLGRRREQRYPEAAGIVGSKRGQRIDGQLCHPGGGGGDESSCINSLLHASKSCYPPDLGHYDDTAHRMNELRSKSSTLNSSGHNYYKELYVLSGGHPADPPVDTGVGGGGGEAGKSQTLSRSILRKTGSSSPTTQQRFVPAGREDHPDLCSSDGGGGGGNAYKSIPCHLSADHLLEPGHLYTELEGGCRNTVDAMFRSRGGTLGGKCPPIGATLPGSRTPKMTSSFV